MTPDARAIFCLFAKPPLVGTVKTRLIPAIGAERATELAAAMLDDTYAQLLCVEHSAVVIASTALDGIALPGATIWLQGEGDLGARIERVLRRALQQAPVAIAVGADTPGLAPADYRAALEAIDGADAVIGPTEDGGFYLLGLRQCPDGLLSELPWSLDTTCEATIARLSARGLRTAMLPSWFDVDRPDDLPSARERLRERASLAPKTVRCLDEWTRSETSSSRPS